MSKLITHSLNWLKIIFWDWEGSNFIEMKNFKKQKSFILCLAPTIGRCPKSKKGKLSPPPTLEMVCNTNICLGSAIIRVDCCLVYTITYFKIVHNVSRNTLYVKLTPKSNETELKKFDFS